MLTLKAHLLNIFTTNEFKKADGTIVPPKSKLQLLIKESMKNGQSKNRLIDLSIPNSNLEKYRSLIGKDVSVDVGIYGKDYGFYGI